MKSYSKKSSALVEEAEQMMLSVWKRSMRGADWSCRQSQGLVRKDETEALSGKDVSGGRWRIWTRPEA